MNYCAKHHQFYSEYCVYCEWPYQITSETSTSIYICEDCQKVTNGRCIKHSLMDDGKIDKNQ